MEAVMMKSTGNNKHRIGNLNRSFDHFGPNRTLFPYPSDNLLYSSFLTGGYSTGGGYMSMPPVFPPAVSGFRSPPNLHHYRQQQQQPPLLPLPITTPFNHHQNIMNNTNITRSKSASNNNIRINQFNKNVKNRVRDHSLTPKKSKNQKKDSKKEVVDLVDPVVDLVHPVTAEEKHAPQPEKEEPLPAKCTKIDDVIGPDPKDLPKKVVISRVLTSSINKSSEKIIDVDEFSGSVMFTQSPPPSSLPLPTFFLRSKVSCKAEASGVDAGATDSLRRLLRL